METIGSGIDNYIKEKVKEILDKNTFPEYDDIHTDTFSELIDKLIIVHVRCWYCEDAINKTTDDTEIANIKRKADIAIKEKRPMLVRGIDKTIYNIINGKFENTPESLKNYDGYESSDKK
jgi:hypothetical protein